jgi:hypothetical protein
MVAKLKEAGVYEEVLLETQKRAENELVDMISRRGIPYHQAWRQVMRERIYLPAEDEVEILSPDLMPYLTPDQQ